MATDFTIADVLAWARTKPADERYDYVDGGNCALCQFLRETGRVADPLVNAWEYYTDAGAVVPLPNKINDAVQHVRAKGAQDWSFGGLVRRLEKLCPDTVIPPSEWTRLDSYMVDIEMVNS